MSHAAHPPLIQGASDPQNPVRAVQNQATPLTPRDLFTTDAALVQAVHDQGGSWGVERLQQIGELAGSQEAAEHGARAERNEPRLITHDRFGRRSDTVDLDPSWFWLRDQAVKHQVHALPWRTSRPGAHVVRAASMMLWSNTDAGVMCPLTMTFAAVPALRDGAPELAARWEPRLTSEDPGQVAMAGMAMTERQGGSDVRANMTVARPAGDGEFELWGHKWFCSYPPCEVFLALAQAPGGLSCFLIERGEGMEFQRLKDKLGTRSLPSSEVEFHGVRARLVGEEGRGVNAILRMVNHTRLDCLLSSAAGMRRGLAEAINHAQHRSAFGARLVDQPAMQNVLADLALDSEAATATALRVARSYDDDEPAFRRLATAIMKYWHCKLAPVHAAESLECLGGNGYIEDSGMPRLYRDAPLNGIWEGTGNVAALDVLRAIVKETDGAVAFFNECHHATGADRHFDAKLKAAGEQVAQLVSDDRPEGDRLRDAQASARQIVEDLAQLLQASVLLRHAPPHVADAFCATRLGGQRGRAYGTLPSGVDLKAIVTRSTPC